MFTVKLLLEAELELTEACEWYEERKTGLGSQFLMDFNNCINLLSKTPEIFGVNFSEKYRFAYLNKFPYSIVYSIDDANYLIIINSVFHQNRNPEKF